MWVVDPFPIQHVAVSEAADNGQNPLCASLNLSENIEVKCQRALYSPLPRYAGKNRIQPLSGW